MSAPNKLDLIPDELWKMYQEWCKAEKVTPELSDFMVWVNDQDIDFEEPEYE